LDSAKKLEQEKKGESGANKSSNRASGVGGSRVAGDPLPGFVIFKVEPNAKWWKHAKFRPPDTTWTHPDNPVVLICDGHGSHLSLPFLLRCKEAGVILI